MEEIESGNAERAPRRRRSRGLWGLGAVVLFLVLWTVVSFVRPRGPLFDGRPVGYWFPRLVWGDSPPEVDWVRLGQLRSAGPEVMPMLLEAVRVQDGVVSTTYFQLHGYAPMWIKRILPRWRTSGDVLDEVHQLVSGLVAKGPLAEAFLERFEQWPPMFKEIWFRVPGPDFGADFFRAHEWPHLAAAPDEDATRWIERAVRHELTSAEQETVLRRALACPVGAWDTTYSVREVVLRLAPRGPRSRWALPWMEQWQASSDRLLSAWGRVATGALAPEKYPLAPALREIRRLMTFAEWQVTLDPWLVGATQRSLPWRDLGEELAADLELLAFDGWSPGRPEMPMGTKTQLLATFYASLGTNCGPAARSVPARLLNRALSERAWAGARTAAIAVARLGHASLETLPEWSQALSNRSTAVPLVLVLASLGPEARAALPQLERVASGEWPLAELEPEQPTRGLSPELVKRYGLRPQTEDPVAERFLPHEAIGLGVAHVWPKPPGGGSPEACTLPELAQEALRRVRGEALPPE